MIGHCPITLRAEDHTYWHENGEQYASVTKLRKSIQKPFAEKEIARSVATSQLRKEGKSYTDSELLIRTMEIIGIWKKSGEDAMAQGSYIDKQIETYFLTGGVVDSKLTELLEGLWRLMENYKTKKVKTYVWSDEHKVAGEIDINCMRRSKNICDYYDTKVKVSKGIQYISKNNDYMLAPLEHLENCSYNDYAMQLSIYGMLGELCYKVKPGKMTLIEINPLENYRYKLIPVPYMKYEAWALLENWRVKQ